MSTPSCGQYDRRRDRRQFILAMPAPAVSDRSSSDFLTSSTKLFLSRDLRLLPSYLLAVPFANVFLKARTSWGRILSDPQISRRFLRVSWTRRATSSRSRTLAIRFWSFLAGCGLFSIFLAGWSFRPKSEFSLSAVRPDCFMYISLLPGTKIRNEISICTHSIHILWYAARVATEKWHDITEESTGRNEHQSGRKRNVKRNRKTNKRILRLSSDSQVAREGGGCISYSKDRTRLLEE